MHRKYLPAAVALAVAAGLFAAACSDDSESDSSAMISGISILDAAGFHGIDETINDDRDIPADAATVARKAQTIVNLTEWPEDLQDEADALEGVFANLATELEKEEPDLTTAGELAGQAHDDLHEFSHDVWVHLQQEAGIETAEGDESHE